MKIKKASAVFRIVLFIIMVAVPMLIYPLLPDSYKEISQAEKRELASFPEVSLENYNNFSEEFDRFIDDHLPFRDTLVTGYSSILYNAFKTSTNDDVIIGKDNWLFYNKESDGNPLSCYRGQNLYSEEDLKNIAASLTASQQALAAEGRQLVLLFIPNKERMYPEYMPDYFGAPAGEYGTLQLYNYLRSNTDINIIYAYNDLMAYKNSDDPARQLYYKGDTHWRHYGAYVISRALLNSIGKDLPLPEDIGIYESEYIHDDNDLSMLLHLEEQQKEPIYLIDSSQLRSDETQPEGRMYVICDSFFNYMEGYVASQVEDYYWDPANFNSVTTSANIREFDADIVVLEAVERLVDNALSWNYITESNMP